MAYNNLCIQQHLYLARCAGCFSSFATSKAAEDGQAPVGSSRDPAFAFLGKCLGKMRILEVVTVKWKLKSVKVTVKWMVFIYCCSHSCLLALYQN